MSADPGFAGDGTDVADKLRSWSGVLDSMARDCEDMGGQAGVNPELLDECISDLEEIRDAG